MPISIAQFIERLSESELLPSEEIEALRERVPANKRWQDAENLMGKLVDEGKLTRYQAEALTADEGHRLVLGDYVLLDRIGAGGMGEVFRARHRRMDRIVALKVLLTSTSENQAAVQRFQREVRAAAKLSHVNIVSAYDAGEEKGILYLVMEYVAGEDLAKHVHKHGPLPLATALDYIRQAAGGLAHAHRLGIIHRDIKPANLLVDPDGTVKILDMGLARFEGHLHHDANDGLTKSGSLMGSADYMAPEQAVDTRVADARADIYSLGCTLFYLLTGQLMYEGGTFMKRVVAHREQPIPALAKARSDASPELCAIFQRMVAKKPKDRYQSVEEVIAALANCVPEGASALARSGGTRTGGGATRGNQPVSKGRSSRRDAESGRTMAYNEPTHADTDPKAVVETSQRRATKTRTATGKRSRNWRGEKKPRRYGCLIFAVALLVVGALLVAGALYAPWQDWVASAKSWLPTPVERPDPPGNGGKTVPTDPGVEVGPGDDPIATPSDLSLTVLGERDIHVSWTGSKQYDYEILHSVDEKEWTSVGVSPGKTEWTVVDLDPATCYHFKVRAKGAKGSPVYSGDSETRWATTKARTLHVLAIGVSKYLDPALGFKSAENNARAFAEAWQRQEGKFFRNVSVQVLVDEQATGSQIAQGLSGLSAATQGDMVLVLLAGRGIVDAQGNYLFYPYDFAPGAPNSINIDAALAGLAATNSLLFLDTWMVPDSRGLSELSSSFTKGTWMFAAESSGSFLLDQAFLRCLDSPTQCDPDGDNFATPSELEIALDQEVRRLSGGSQGVLTSTASSKIPLLQVREK